MPEQVPVLTEIITGEMEDLAETVEAAQACTELANQMYDICQEKLMEAQDEFRKASAAYYQSLRDLDYAKDRLAAAAHRYGVTADAAGTWS